MQEGLTPFTHHHHFLIFAKYCTNICLLFWPISRWLRVWFLSNTSVQNTDWHCFYSLLLSSCSHINFGTDPDSECQIRHRDNRHGDGMKIVIFAFVLLTGCTSFEQAQREIEQDRMATAARIAELQKVVDDNISEDTTTVRSTIIHSDGSRTTIRTRVRVPWDKEFLWKK